MKLWVGSFNMAFKDLQTAWETYLRQDVQYKNFTKHDSYILLNKYIPDGYDIYVMGL